MKYYNTMKNRWYDNDPTLSLAISLLQNSELEVRHRCADLAIEIAMKNKIVIKNNVKSAIGYLFRRWYDKDEIVAESMEYINAADEKLRKEIALSMIEFLQNI